MSGPPFPEAEGATPEAPFGLTVTGRPKKRPGGRPRKGTTPPNRADAPAPAAKKATAPRPTAAKKRDFRGPLEAALTMSLSLNRYKLPEPVQMDVATVYVLRKPLAEAGNEYLNVAAKKYPKFGMWLDKAAALGPNALAAGIAAKLVAQVAYNHGVIPANIAKLAGALNKDELLATLEKEVRKQAAAEGLDLADMERQAAEDAHEADLANRVRREGGPHIRKEPVGAGG